MGWRGFLKGVAMTVLLAGSVVGLWYGVILALSGGAIGFFAGLVTFVVAFRAIILAFDLMWGRPPAFSKRPWERPWEDEQRRE